MPGAYAIDVSRGLVLTRGWGTLTDDDLLGHVRAVAADPRFRPHFAQLADLLGVTSVAPTAAGIEELGLLNPFGEGSRRALVVQPGAAYGLSRMYQTVRSENRDELELFHDIDAAIRWLGLAESKDELLRALARAPQLSVVA